MSMAYSSPFEGATVNRSELAGDFSAEMQPTMTGSVELSNGGELAGSPIDRRIAASNWSREDVELTVRVLSAAATIAALWLTYQGGR